jgi:hypothetical protein
MESSSDSLVGVTSKLAEQLKIKASSPMFKIKLKLKKGLKKMNPFSAMMQGKATKDQTQQQIVKANSTGEHMVYRGLDPDKPDPYADEPKTLRNGMLVPMLSKNPFHINTSPGNLSNY